MLQASTQSYIAKNLEVKRNGTNFEFKFEHRTVNVAITEQLTADNVIRVVAQQAATRLFSNDCLGALLNLRMQGDSFDFTDSLRSNR